MLVDAAVTSHARLCRKPVFSNEPSVLASGLVYTPCFRVRDFNEKPWVVPLSMRHEVSDLRGFADLADCYVVYCCAAGPQTVCTKPYVLSRYPRGFIKNAPTLFVDTYPYQSVLRCSPLCSVRCTLVEKIAIML